MSDILSNLVKEIKTMGKKSNITHECIQAFKKQEKFGRSKFDDKQKAKNEAIERGETFKNVQGLYSFKSEQIYIKNAKHFINYCLDEHKADIKHYSDCRKYVEEYLQHEIDRGLSAWTIHTRACALCSSYNIRLQDLEINLPARKREDISRTRGYDSSKYKDIDERYREIKTFIRATGCRRGELLNLRREDIKISPSGKNVQILKRGKGGVERWTLVNPKYNELVIRMFKENEGYRTSDGEERIFKSKQIPSSAIHDLRADYARDMYKLYEYNNYGNGEKYYCRGERVGDSFDKGILEKVSYDMCHHRCDVVVNNYLYGMHGKN